MAKAEDIKAKARAGLSAVRRGLASGAKATGLRARALGRRVSSVAAQRRRSYCARTEAPQSNAQILKVINEAVELAARRLNLTLPKIDSIPRALMIGRMLSARKDRLSRLAGEASLRAAYAMTSDDENEWNEAAMYADDAIDEAGKS
jgi:hypothetical protein